MRRAAGGHRRVKAHHGKRRDRQAGGEGRPPARNRSEAPQVGSVIVGRLPFRRGLRRVIAGFQGLLLPRVGSSAGRIGGSTGLGDRHDAAPGSSGAIVLAARACRSRRRRRSSEACRACPARPGCPRADAGGGFGAAPQQGPPRLPAAARQPRRDPEARPGDPAAGKKKVGPEEACKLFKAFLASETKMIKGWKSTARPCGVPPDGHQAGQGPARARRTGRQAGLRCGGAQGAAPSRPEPERRARHHPDGAGCVDRAKKGRRHLRHPDRQSAGAMTDGAGRVADSTGNWVDGSPRLGASLPAARPPRPADRLLAAADAVLVVGGARRDRRRQQRRSLARRAVLRRRLRHARRGLHLERHRRPRPRCAGRAHALAADPVGTGERRRRRGVPRAAGAGRARGAAPVQSLHGLCRLRLARRGRGLSVHEADHLLAADRARPRLLLGRADGLAGDLRRGSIRRPSCSMPARSPG